MIGMMGIMGIAGLIIGIIGIAVSATVGGVTAAQNKAIADKEAAARKKTNHISAQNRRIQRNTEEKNRRITLNQAAIGNAVARWKTRKLGYETSEYNRKAAVMSSSLKPSTWQRRSYYGNA
jgi:uncharacterized protein YlxW (UPF0749 family)